MIFTKKNDNTDILTIEESSQLFDINSIPVIESDNYYFIDYDTISPIREAYDLSVENIVSTLKYNNLIESNIVVNIEDSNLIEDKSLLEEYNNYQVYSVPTYSDESIIIEAVLQNYEDSGDDTLLENVIDGFELIVVQEETSNGVKVRKFKDPKTGREYRVEVENQPSVDNGPVRGKITGKTMTMYDDKGNVVKARYVTRNRTAFMSGAMKDTYVPNATGDSYEVTKKEFMSQGKKQKRNVTLAKAASNTLAAGIVATPIALLNRKRIARGISKLNEKLKYYRDKKNSGPIVAKIKQMIRKLQAKLNQKFNSK